MIKSGNFVVTDLYKIFLTKEKINLENREKVANPEKTVFKDLSFSIIWSLGANLYEYSRHFFGELFRN